MQLLAVLNAMQAESEKLEAMQRALAEHQRSIISKYIIGSSM